MKSQAKKNMCNRILRRMRPIILAISLILLISLGIVGIVQGSSCVRHVDVKLEDTSVRFERWQTPEAVDFKIYVFNVTNPDVVSEGGNPVVTEIGPYVYTEYREKTIQEYGADDTITYIQNKTYHFDPKASGHLTDDDEVVVINAPYVAGMTYFTYDYPPSRSMAVEANGYFEKLLPNFTDLFIKVKVKELFFEGIYFNCDNNTGLTDPRGRPIDCSEIKKAGAPPTIRPEKDEKGFYFSLLGHLNGTASRPYQVKRGRANIYDLGKIVSFQGRKSDEICSKVKGTDFSTFPPLDGNHFQNKLYTYDERICWSPSLTYTGKERISDMTAYHYEIDIASFKPVITEPKYNCFCGRNWSRGHDECSSLQGVLNVAPCQGGAILSLPHFYLASEEILGYFDGGIKPDKEKHNTYVNIDPTTGIVIKGVKRLQFNIEVLNIPHTRQLSKVQNTLVPLVWIEENVKVSHDVGRNLQQSC